MKKFSILLLVILLTFVSCKQTPQYWKFEKDSTEVTEIKIVDLSQSGLLYNPDNYVIIKSLDLTMVDQLYDDIENLKMRHYGTNLNTPRGKCFMIVFANGEFDLISVVESKHFRYDYRDKNSSYYGTLQAFNSWLKCNEEQFNDLINKYLNTETGDAET